jgi:hypothetical protein
LLERSSSDTMRERHIWSAAWEDSAAGGPRERTEARESVLERREREVETSLTGSICSTLPLASASANLEVRQAAAKSELSSRMCIECENVC